MELQFFYRKDTHQIDGVFIECKSNSIKFKDKTVYQEVNVEDPPYAVTRDHKVVLNSKGQVVDTVMSPNPVQPSPSPNPNQDLIDELNNLWPSLTASQKRELLRKAIIRILGR